MLQGTLPSGGASTVVVTARAGELALGTSSHSQVVSNHSSRVAGWYERRRRAGGVELAEDGYVGAMSGRHRVLWPPGTDG
jgi:hypothetical protein